MMLPILYTVLTTICAFLSLVFSGIKPIIDFGWMMTLGLIVSLLVTFLLLPSLLNLFSSKDEIDVKDTEKSFITSVLGSFAKNNKILIFGSALLIVIFSVVGIFKLEVENSFINYFSKNTEIYKGMKLIDEKLGGTTPLEVIIKFPKKDTETVDDEDECDESEEEYDSYESEEIEDEVQSDGIKDNEDEN